MDFCIVSVIKEMKRAVVVLALFFSYSGYIHAQEKVYSITFDPALYTVKSAEVDGSVIQFRAYENVVYVTNPVDARYQCLNLYVPAAYYENKSIDGYNAANAPIFFPNDAGGYMPALPGTVRTDGFSGKANAALVALFKGYVVAYPGARGRSLKDASGKYYGKAPAQIVDLKAAVRYLKYNDGLIPGDANKIISNGTSAGGAMSTLLGGTGNSKDYDLFLKAIGAADATDDIFAVSAYCPITDLDHADAAYEWLYSDTESDGKLTDEQLRISRQLKASFPAYVNALKLKDIDGSILTLDKNGNGSFRDYVGRYLIASAQKALDAGKNLKAFDWLTIRGDIVQAVDFPKYVRYIKRMKLPPAFDATDLSSVENDLFGTEDIPAQHFTRFGLQNSKVKSTLAEVHTIQMMNALYYIGSTEVTTAKCWRIRHGTVDRHGSLAVPAIFAAKLQNLGYRVSLAFPWEVSHSGDYDLDELFEWIRVISKEDL